MQALALDQVVKHLVTDIGKSLDAAEASRRLQKHGPNRLPEGKKRGPFARFLAQLNNILVYVLLGAGFTKLMLGLWLDAGIIFGVVLLNALLGFIQEGKAEKALDSIRNMLSAEARTTRDGVNDPPPTDPDRVRHLADHLRRAGARRVHAVGVLLDEGAGRIGTARPDGRR